MKKLNKTVLANLEEINKAQNNRKFSQKNSLLALDYGEKFCGLAWSPDGVVSLPLEIIENKSPEETKTKIHEVFAKKKCQKLIIGLPISGNGAENKTCQQIRNFAKFLDIKNLEFANERGSSQSTIPSRKSREKNKRIDDLAAAKILEYWLAI